jgi:hypothetical protein
LDDNIKPIKTTDMMNLEFTKRIKALRRELIDAIIAELNNHGVTSFEFPDDLERCERPWQICTDVNDDPCECYVSKMEICGCDNDHLRIYSDDDYDSYTTLTSCDYEAKDVEFLSNLYLDLQYYLNETK